VGLQPSVVLYIRSKIQYGRHSKLNINVPYEVPTKCYYFRVNPIWPPWPQIGRHIFDFFSRTASRIHSKLSTHVPYEVTIKCYYFKRDPKSNMATLASDCLTHFRLLLKNNCRDLLQTCLKCSLWVPDQVLILQSRSEIQYGYPGLWLADTFSTSSQERLQESTLNLA